MSRRRQREARPATRRWKPVVPGAVAGAVAGLLALCAVPTLHAGDAQPPAGHYRAEAAACDPLEVCDSLWAPLTTRWRCSCPSSARPAEPLYLFQAPPETVYAPPPIVQPGEGFNDGALSVNVTSRVLTHYIFRGVEIVDADARDDAPNWQIDAMLQMDLGRLPDPFVRLFTNTAPGDPISNFQVIRPIAGLEWSTEAFVATLGHQLFTYPDRDELNTAEVFLEFRFNDGLLIGEEDPIVGPYIFAAWDYDRFNGVYIELGLERTFDIADTNLSLTFSARTGYMEGLGELFGADADDPRDRGLIFYEVGVMPRYELNRLLNVSRRYGQWGIEGYLFYTDSAHDELRAESQLWGGLGIVFRY